MSSRTFMMLQMRTQDTLCALRRITIIFPPFAAKCEILKLAYRCPHLQAQGFRKGANGVRKVSFNSPHGHFCFDANHTTIYSRRGCGKFLNDIGIRTYRPLMAHFYPGSSQVEGLQSELLHFRFGVRILLKALFVLRCASSLVSESSSSSF